MKMTKKMWLIPASALLLASAAGAAQADNQPLERLDDVLTHAETYGFTHFEEIETKSRGRIEVEGWLDDEWFAETRFSLESGETLREKRERLITGAWGMSADEVRQAFEVAKTEGMTKFEEIEIDESGMIEIEGRDGDGQELEISLRQGSDQVTEIDRD
ncbi:PepSY domain-containing protein [Halomonas vilamensis]|uniref:PepSY domain-containing protein n=1 Tax=Vreelandella vilamensis TaxID=531309 RepID=A0ABU1H707_9GAMM|nr:PepSY domain-containing protein [Halomonas vilamensis]MDR5900082.1 PepSY domain-containing protein [Halomonas vilamensis]